jgi:PTH1 family peptidyl-tRNA hydrolase
MAVLGQLARRLGVAESWARDQRCAADLALAPLGDAQLVLLRPRRLMNANGRSVAQAGELRALEGAGGKEGTLAAASACWAPIAT